MFKFALNGTLGFVILLGVLVISIFDRGETEISFFDWHAAAVVVGGVIGSLLIAVKGHTFIDMVRDWIKVVFGRDTKRAELNVEKSEIEKMLGAWKQGKRADVLNLIEHSPSPAVRVAAGALVQRLQGQRFLERFDTVRAEIQDHLGPQIEGWDMVARLAPSFGIVGTVAGMVQLFRNMANNSGNLGGAMALALLATLYGILLGTALGGPMSTRLNQLLSESLSSIDILERHINALIEEDLAK